MAKSTSRGLLGQRSRKPKSYYLTKFLLGPLGWCYLIVVLDWYTKEIVGWNLSLRAKTSEWKEALDGALCEKFPWGVRDQGLNLVSDNGSQPTSVAFMKGTAELGINPSDDQRLDRRRP